MLLSQQNLNNTVYCVGITWLRGTFGPEGEAGGSQCYYKWEIQGLGSIDSGADSAQMQVAGITVNSAKKFLTCSLRMTQV
jgi:hypothetical protein